MKEKNQNVTTVASQQGNQNQQIPLIMLFQQININNNNNQQNVNNIQQMTVASLLNPGEKDIKRVLKFD